MAYRSAKAEADKALASLQAFNSKWADVYKKIPMGERMSRRKAKDGIVSKALLAFGALLALFLHGDEQRGNAEPANYDLTTYQPEPRRW